MADVAFDAVSQAAPASGTSLTWSHTCTGANGSLWVYVEVASTTDVLTGITYNGVALSNANNLSLLTNGTICGYFYHLDSPATGANNIVASLSTTKTIAGCALSVTNANQGGQPNAFFTGVTSGQTSITLHPTSTIDRCWQILFASNDTGVIGAGTGSTLRAATNKEASAFDHVAVLSPAGEYFMTVTQGAASNWMGVSIMIAPVGATTPGRALTLLGVG